MAIHLHKPLDILTRNCIPDKFCDQLIALYTPDSTIRFSVS